MDGSSIVAIAALMALAAALYSSVGHGGASAYLAIMALYSVAPETMRPTALALNLLVAGYAAWQFWRDDLLNWRLALAFSIAAAPAAYIGGGIALPPEFYRPLVGVLLWLAAINLLWRPIHLAERPVRRPSLGLALPTGAALGLLAGITGTGGGIFLSPLIILLGWEEARRTSGVVAVFILLNSAAGLAGNLTSVGSLPRELPVLLTAVGTGAVAGVWLGVRRLPRAWLLRALGLVLIIAGAKLVLA